MDLTAPLFQLGFWVVMENLIDIPTMWDHYLMFFEELDGETILVGKLPSRAFQKG